MPGQEVGYSLGLLAGIGMLSLAGIALALRILPREVSANGVWAVATRVVTAGLLLAVTAWLLFLLALKFHFPHLELDIPWPATLQSWTIIGVGAVVALGIAVRTRRSVRKRPSLAPFWRLPRACRSLVRGSAFGAIALA